MKLVAYMRVSTDRQAEQGYGLDVQERAIRQCAKQLGVRLTAIYTDEGLSGTTEAVDRPGLAQALDDIANGRSQGLLVPRLDRLARSLSVQEAALAHVWRYGGRVFSCDTGEIQEDSPDDPMRTAMRQMMGVFSQLERSMITARMRAGRKMKAEAGGYAFGGPPLGFKAQDRALVPDPQEQATLARIQELRNEGKSLRAIAAILESEGHSPKRSARWHPQTLAQVVRRLEAA